MLRRIFLIAASTAMLALSALPASAATLHMQSSTHKLYFPSLHGVNAWGSYTKTSKGVRLWVCVDDTARGVYAAGAVALVSNASGSLHTNFGAVEIGYHQAVCRSMIAALHRSSQDLHVHRYQHRADRQPRARSRPFTENAVDPGQPRRPAAAGRGPVARERLAARPSQARQHGDHLRGTWW